MNMETFHESNCNIADSLNYWGRWSGGGKGRGQCIIS